VNALNWPVDGLKKKGVLSARTNGDGHRRQGGGKIRELLQIQTGDSGGERLMEKYGGGTVIRIQTIPMFQGTETNHGSIENNAKALKHTEKISCIGHRKH
jgi:hypothetical protein